MASSPGLACFVLATALIISTVVSTYDYQLEAPNIAFHPSRPLAKPAPPPASSAAPIPQDKVDNELDKVLKALEERKP